MLAQADTSLSGSLTHHDLPGVMQMLGHAHQTGALHINAGETDAVLFFDAGEITHAECGSLFGDEAVIHIIKNCVHGGAGVYKFVYGATATQRTVLRSATDLMLDAMREYDEGSRDMADKEAAMSEAMLIPPLGDAPQNARRRSTSSTTAPPCAKSSRSPFAARTSTSSPAPMPLPRWPSSNKIRPDAVITDVIMPDQDGYSVCTQIKQHPQFGNVPVVLMSGVVNKTVADKAVAVQADELIRKPFQPQELIGRVKSLLEPKSAAPSPAAQRTGASNALSNLFAPPPAPAAPRNVAPTQPPPAQQPPESVWPRALAEAFTPRQPAQQNQDHQQSGSAPARPSPTAADVHKLRVEISHLDLLVKKLQTELQIERQYNQALETQIRTLTEVE